MDKKWKKVSIPITAAEMLMLDASSIAKLKVNVHSYMQMETNLRVNIRTERNMTIWVSTRTRLGNRILAYTGMVRSMGLVILKTLKVTNTPVSMTMGGRKRRKNELNLRII